ANVISPLLCIAATGDVMFSLDRALQNISFILLLFRTECDTGQDEAVLVPAKPSYTTCPLPGLRGLNVRRQVLASFLTGMNVQAAVEQLRSVYFTAPGEEIHRHRPSVLAFFGILPFEKSAPLLSVIIACRCY